MAAAEGARENGGSVKVFHLNRMKNVKGCQACMVCKTAGRCVLKDDLTEVLDTIRDGEGAIISTPLYFGEACGQFRLLQDRFFSFIGEGFKPNIAGGKKLATIVTCGSGKDSGAALADKLEGVMAHLLGFSPVGKMVFSGGDSPSAAAGDRDAVAAAKSLGEKF
jgi:multimeric flavodoxin WrbA